MKDKAGDLDFVGAVTNHKAQDDRGRPRGREGYLGESAEDEPNRQWAWSAGTGWTQLWSGACYRVLGSITDGLPRDEDFFQQIHPDDRRIQEWAESLSARGSEFEADTRRDNGGPSQDITSLLILF